MEAHGVDFLKSWLTDGSEIVSCPLSPGTFLVLISVRGWVNPRAIVWLEGIRQLRNPMASSGTEPKTLWLVAYCLNQLHYCMAHNILYIFKNHLCCLLPNHTVVFKFSKEEAHVILDISRGHRGQPITHVFKYFPGQNTLLYVCSYQVRYSWALKFLEILLVLYHDLY